MCVASQGSVDKTRLTLGLTGLRDLFGADALFSAYSVARGKPAPDLFLHAASTMGADPARAVVIEDTPSGVTGAVRAGMRAFGRVAEPEDEPALRRAGAETFTTMHELPALLGLGERRTGPPRRLVRADPPGRHMRRAGRRRSLGWVPATAATEGDGMRAVRFDEYGGLDVLEVRDVPDPVAGPGEVLVAVKAAGSTPARSRSAKGACTSAGPPPFPRARGRTSPAWCRRSATA